MMLSTKVATATATTIGQSGPSALDRVAMNHRADVDAEHPLGGNANGPGYPAGSQRRQRKRDADDERGEQCGGRYAEHGQRDCDGDCGGKQQQPLGCQLQSLLRHY